MIMKLKLASGFFSLSTKRVVVVAIMMLVFGASLAVPAKAQSNDAEQLLKAMFKFVANQKSLSVSFDTDVEVVTSNLQKIQFSSSGHVQLTRPDKLRATRTGGYRDVEIVFDGRALTLNDKDANDFTQLNAPGSIDQLIDLLRDKFGVIAPGADILFSDAYDVMMADVIESAHIGMGVIDGVECEHLAFRNSDVDWQIWIEAGARPIPRKYVITSKGVTSAPQYTLRIKEWRNDVPTAAFTFNAAQGAKKVAPDNLRHIDEIPQGTVTAGGQK